MRDPEPVRGREAQELEGILPEGSSPDGQVDPRQPEDLAVFYLIEVFFSCWCNDLNLCPLDAVHEPVLVDVKGSVAECGAEIHNLSLHFIAVPDDTQSAFVLEHLSGSLVVEGFKLIAPEAEVKPLLMPFAVHDDQGVNHLTFRDVKVVGISIQRHDDTDNQGEDAQVGEVESQIGVLSPFRPEKAEPGILFDHNGLSEMAGKGISQVPRNGFDILSLDNLRNGPGSIRELFFEC